MDMIGMGQSDFRATSAGSLVMAKFDKAIAGAQAIHDRAVAENRDVTASEKQEFDRLLAEADTIAARLKEQRQMQDHIQGRQMSGTNNGTDGMVFDSTGSGPAGGYADQNFRFGNGPHIILPKLSAFKGPEATRNAYDSSLWFRGFVLNDGAARAKLESRRPQWMASQNEASPTAGGYTVPPEFHRAIIEYREQVGVARKLPTVLPMGSDNLTVPKLTSGVTTYIVGEESTITDSSMAFGRVNLVPKKRACLTYISSELADDNAVSLMDLTAQRMALSMALQEDSEFVNGDGSSTYGGIVGVKTKFVTATAGVVQCATGNDTWPEITFADIAKCMSAVASKYRTAGQLAFLCSTSFKWQVLDRLALAQGGALMQSMIDGVRVDLFNGYPVFTSDYLPTTTAAATICMYFGNFKQASLFGDRQTLRLALSEHLAFVTDQVAVRCTSRYDMQNHEFGDGSTAGAVVALKTAA